MNNLDSLLKDVLYLLQDIQSSHKGSMGDIDNVYLPQLTVARVDDLAFHVRLHTLLRGTWVVSEQSLNKLIIE